MKPVLQVSPKAVSLHYAEGQIATYDLLRVNSHTLAPLLKHKMSGLRVQKFFVVINKWLNFWVTWFFHRSSHWRMRNDVGSDWGTELWMRHLSFLSRTCSTPICHGSLKQNWFSLLVSISKSWSAQQASANLSLILWISSVRLLGVGPCSHSQDIHEDLQNLKECLKIFSVLNYIYLHFSVISQEHYSLKKWFRKKILMTWKDL